ncbi:NAD-dependent isocitrate dehydrogenase [Candidatus Saccharibacteria bacterium]|nr:NAD-dependent isocitrate dehydrogenase [Candidatus Saccharibacteria bacterium]
MKHVVTVIPGDGIGPEVVNATTKVLDSMGLDFEWEKVELNSEIMQSTPSSIPQNICNLIKKNKIAVKGPISTPVGEGFTSPNVLIRQQLGLYASVRPAKSIGKFASTKKPLDIVTVRENTEDVYVARERGDSEEVIAEKVITRLASERIAKYAFDLAIKMGRKKVTALHKADILKKSDGLFISCCREVSKNYSKVVYAEAIVDSACMQLVLDPKEFDVIVAPNMYGDIVSDIAAGIVGGLGLVGSANMGDDLAVYEAVHGSAPNIAGKNIANPTGLLEACVMMLYNIKEPQAAESLRAAIDKTLEQGAVLTPDLGGNASTTDFRDAIIANL